MHAAVNEQSTQFCGCDPGEQWVCEHHRNRLGNLSTHSGPVKIELPKTVVVRSFETGATRNVEGDKFDYEAFLSPSVLFEYGKFMHEHRKQRDGSLREGDNWQKGIPFTAYIKSLVRHTIDLWRMHRGITVLNPDTGAPHTKRELCCAIMFNSMGYLHELVKAGE